MQKYDGIKTILQKNIPIKNAYVSLNNGVTMPVVGLGTYRIVGRETIFNVVDSALKAGYRSFDSAAGYGNESDIGAALKQFLPKYNLQREDIFITSKLAPRDQGKDKVRQAVELSLSNLKVSYIDLYLIHWPGVGGIPTTEEVNRSLRRESWEGLVSLVTEGKLRSIGVSNYTARHLSDLLANSSYPPAVNQVEFHPFFRQEEELLQICEKHQVLLQAYSSFGGTGERSLLQEQTILQVSEKLNVKPSQLLLRWALQHGLAVIPKTVNERRMEENLELDFDIPKEYMKVINDISTRKKFAWNPENVF